MIRLQRCALSFAGLLLLAGASQLRAQTPPIVIAIDAIQFAHQIGTADPVPQTIHIFTSAPNTPYTATAATLSGGGWLAVGSALTATANTPASGHFELPVSVSAQGLTTPGTYQGTVTIQIGGATKVINVNLAVSTAVQIRLNPSSIPTLTVEANRTATIPVDVASSNVPLTQYIATVVSADPNTNWLIPPNSPGQTNGQAQVIINAAAIPADRAFVIGAVRFTSVASGNSVTLPIAVLVVAGAQLQVSPSVINFPYQFGGPLPTAKAVTVTSSTTNQLIYNATITSASPWLQIASTSTGPGSTSVAGLTTPGSLYLIPNVAAVAQTPGTQEATIRLDAPLTGSSITLTARLNLSNQPQLTLTQDSVVFAYTLGGNTPAPVSLTVGSTSQSQGVSIATTYTSGGQFFTVQPSSSGTTPFTLTLSPNPTVLASLAAGTYTGSIRVASANSTVDIPVSLTISGTSLITVDNFGTQLFEGALGQTPTAKSLIVRSTDATNQPFNISVEYGTGASGWLLVSPSGSASTGTTGVALSLNVNPGAVTAAGSYTASLVLTPTAIANAPAVRIPIQYNVSGASSITATPPRFDLTQTGTTPPAQQTIALTSGLAGLTWFASASQPWIQLTNTTGSIPGSVVFTLNSASLAPGNYSGNIVISVSGVQTLTIPVALTVQAGSTLQVSPTSLTFSASQGAAASTQTVNVTSSAAATQFTAQATTNSGGSWLSVTPTSGTTTVSGGAPVALTVSANPQGLAVGTYAGTITLTPQGASSPAVTINVSLSVSAAAAPTSVTITNAATGVSRGVSPGQIVTLKGRNMAPAQGVSFTVQNGAIPTTLSDVKVTFDGVEAPILYAGPSGDKSSDQINAIVPYSISGRLSTRMVVSYRGIMSGGLDLRVIDTDPGIFTANQSGTGPAAVLNQDNTVNSTNTAAARGSVIQIFGTGEGLLSPAQSDGRVVSTTAPFPTPLAPVTVRINGVAARVLYAGSAPGLVAGVLQINAEVPASLNLTGPALVSLEVQAGQNVSQGSLTVAVRP